MVRSDGAGWYGNKRGLLVVTGGSGIDFANNKSPRNQN